MHDSVNVLVVDDDPTWPELFTRPLEYEQGFSIRTATSLDDAVRALNERGYAVAVIDYYMRGPAETPHDGTSSAGICRTGLDFARYVAEVRPATNILIVTQAFELPLSHGEIDILRRRGIEIHFKRDMPPERLCHLVKRARDRSLLRILIIHGRDLQAVQQLRSYLRHDLGIRDVVVAQDTPGAGMTLIEKFEQCAENIDVAFALFTPDDVGALREASHGLSPRARQNVVFELGYVVARLGRLRRRVVILTKGKMELPSDIAGMLTIDITDGISPVVGSIKRELEAVF